MKLIKLTVVPLLLFTSILVLTSCEKDAEKKKTTDFSKTGIVLSGANEVPANPSAAKGLMDVFYSKVTRTLSYTVTWSGLPVPPHLMHIHGLAPAGFAAAPVQTILGGTANPTLFPANNGKYSGTLLVDGVVVKEENLLNGFYYMNIHTPLPYYPGGEIRGQIIFQ